MNAVRRVAAGEAPALAAVVRGLPEYFTDDVPGKVEHDADSHEAWVITDDGTITGFVIAARKSPGGAEILWIAVDAPRRGQGHGTRLLNNVMDDLAQTGVSVVTVKTLDSSAGYAPYEATRAFYEHNGFVYVDTIDPLPGWPPGNPAAIYAAAWCAESHPANDTLVTVVRTGMGEPAAGGSIQMESATGRCGGLKRSRMTRPASLARYSAGLR